jgi:hypothetical protein
MKAKTKIADHQSVIEEVEAKQKNTAWPDTRKNSRSVDAFLWKGSPDAPLIQRMGAWVFGLFFILCGMVCARLAYTSHSWADALYSTAGFLIGGRVFLNGFRKRKAHSLKKE